jgi:hypothetical protein
MSCNCNNNCTKCANKIWIDHMKHEYGKWGYTEEDFLKDFENLSKEVPDSFNSKIRLVAGFLAITCPIWLGIIVFLT